MLSRRLFCSACAATAAAAFAAVNARAESCAVLTPERQAAMSPDEALDELKAGNARFLAGTMRNCDLLAQVRATAKGQSPFAVVLGCIDSRVPPEIVFDQRIGDIFSARVAGNVVSPDILGSLEFATKLAGARLILVLGHTECGAIKGAIDHAVLGDLTQLLAKMEPAIAAVKADERTSKDKTFVRDVTIQNVRDAMAELRTNATLRQLHDDGAIRIAGALHDVSTGAVTFFD